MPRPSNPSPSLPVHAMPRLIVHTCVLKFSSPSCYSYTFCFFEVERTCVYVAVSQRGLPLREHEEQNQKKKLTIPSKPYHAQRKVCLSPHLSPMHLVPLGERPRFSSPILFGRRVRLVVLVVPHGRRVHTLPFQLFFLHGRAHLCQSRAEGGSTRRIV